MKLLSLAFAALLLSFNFQAPSAQVKMDNKYAANETTTYSIENFTSLPTGWELYSKCDTANTRTTYSNNEMVITNANTTSNALYYGSVYYVNTENNWKDFTFEATIKMSNPADANRWFGIGYHTQETAGNMMGYLMNYRAGGDSAFSAFNNSQAFNDGSRVNTQNVKLNDGNYHTLKVVMQDYQATHYIDNKQVISWDTRERTTHLGGTDLKYGKFALFVNRSTINVKKVSISGTLADEKETIKDESIVETYKPLNGLINFPTVVTDIKTSDSLNSLTTSASRPSNAILHVDNELNVIDENNNSLGSLSSVIDDKLQKKVIPVVYLENSTQASKFIELLDKKLIIDMAIMSKDASLIKMVKDNYSVIRGIYHVNEIPSDVTLSDLVHEANMNYAGVIALDDTCASRENVTYLQARFKAVWINQTNESDINLYSSVNTGCYGMIVNDYENLYTLYLSYEKGTLIRTPFNVAHRGFPALYNENSVYGTQKSIENGATHIELDAYLTTDNEIAIMHDGTIDRTSNGTGNVESYSLSQLKQFSLDLKAPAEPIPSLEDVAEPIVNSDAVLVLEIKSGNLRIVDVLRDKLEELDLLSRTVVISFNTGILGKMKSVIPEIPTANLNEARTSNLASVLYWMGSFNTGIDTHYTHINNIDNHHYLTDRGIMGWYWTYDTASVIDSQIPNGVIGMTNNSCNYFFNQIRYVYGQEFTLEEGQNIEEATFNLLFTTYDGYEDEIEGQLFKYEDKGDYYEVICQVDTEFGKWNVSFYTEIFKVNKHDNHINTETPNTPPPSSPEQPPVDQPQETNVPLVVGLSVGGAIVLGGGVTVLLILKKRKIK